MNFTPFDLRTADLGPGTVLLEASAGTGKTYALVGILLRMLLEGRIERMDQALVMTFTIAATDELKTRLRSALQRTLAAASPQPPPEADAFFTELGRRPGAAGKLRQALAAFDQVGISTIHGFCKRVLEEAAFESHEPFRLEFAADPAVLLEQAAADAMRAGYEPGATLRNHLLHTNKVTPQLLVEWYRLWQRYPDVALEPASPDFAPWEQCAAAALPSAAESFDADAAALLAQMKFYAGDNPFGEDVEAGLDHFAQGLRRNPASQMAVLAQLGTRALRATLLKKSVGPGDHPFFIACDGISEAFAEGWKHLRSDLLLRMHQRVYAQKRAEHVLSFDDLLRRTHAALHDEERGEALAATLRARYRVALIDEFQDTDELQYGIFDACFRDATMFLIGDPKQAIYGFRGADLRTYIAARGKAQRHHTLAVNYRSSAAMVAATGALFARRFAFAEASIAMPTVRANAADGGLALADPQGGEAFCWRHLAAPAGAKNQQVATAVAETRIANDVVAEIRRLLLQVRLPDGKGGDRAVQPRDIAILTRRNTEAVLMQDTLRQANIHSAIGKAGDIFETDEVEELDRVLQAILQPGNLAAVRGALATRFFGLDASAVQALDADDAGLESHLERLDQWRRLWHRSGFVPMVEQALVDRKVVKRFLGWQGGERRLTNFRQLVLMLHEAEHEGRRSPEGLLEWLRRERANQDDLDYTVRELRLESDEDAVQILTMHGSKGLEYEIVFCPFLWRGVKPKSTTVVATGDRGHGLAFGVNKDSEHRGPSLAAELGEDLRLCYVALTRSRRRCYVHFGHIGSPQGGAFRSGVAWLLGADDGTLTATGAWPADWALTWSEDSKKNAGRWWTRIQELVAASHGGMSCTSVADDLVVPPLPPTPAPGLRPAERPERRVRARGMHSFTSLIANAPGLEVARDVADPAAEPTPAPAAGGMHGFARGTAAGLCLHSILEHADLANLPEPATKALVRSTLAAHGLVEPGAHPGEPDPVPTVLRMLHEVAAATLPQGTTLAALCGGARFAEWEFLLPAERAAVPALAAVLRRHGGPAAVAQATRLAAMAPATLRGFLIGFVDLVAEHDGRYWVLDWKSNHLGPTTEAYDESTVLAAMLGHDYVLQYHLYVLALHRHLRQRLRDYDPARHLGGVCYVFLRGLRPGTANGLFVDLVPTALVHAMDRWLAGEADVARDAGGRP